MRVEHARRRLSALSAFQCAAVRRTRAERAKAEVMPECSGVLVGSGGGQERRVRVVGAAGDVAHCVVYREDAAGRQVTVKLVEWRRRQCRADW